MTDEGITKVAELVKDARISMFTTVDADGRLVSRPMALQEVEFDGDLWFFADDSSDTVSEVAANPAVNISFSSGDSWVSVTGNASVVRDRAKSEELWNSFVEAWFPDGPDTPGVVLLKVDTHAAQYWDTPGGKVVQLYSMIKSKVAGERYDGGDTGTVQLD
ncbi:General stress protein 26 [Georgenia satyanarayanai]|uniref:General stress protein 26 n=1 Tax=Georgenia satyanarayanai TaxID=860221 RepID=A0A2Y9BV11_9MICO|nr:pyridoxamine 5'-phosphate oxidase family protein [Georgenia satyanarayanai]PYG01792.1 general stress protein 26 [Georgenia satyanarayanai]SSA36592.1 General stress protein 26 [Georgenia satyanarayanai]